MKSLEHFLLQIPKTEISSADAEFWMRYKDPHVGTDDMALLKRFIKLVLKNQAAMAREKKPARLKAYMAVIQIHRRNRALYFSVMGGC